MCWLLFYWYWLYELCLICLRIYLYTRVLFVYTTVLIKIIL
nr:MAG TPA: hypothetical protein [Caudoviricetes sp.]